MGTGSGEDLGGDFSRSNTGRQDARIPSCLDIHGMISHHESALGPDPHSVQGSQEMIRVRFHVRDMISGQKNPTEFIQVWKN